MNRQSLRTLLVCGAAFLSAASAAHATTLNATQALGTYQFSVSDAFGSGNFGSVTISSLGGTTVDIAVTVSPNFFLDTGAHELLTFSLVSGASIVPGSLTGTGASHFTISGPLSPAVGNPPFGNFTWEITSNCTQGNCGPTNGQSLDFHVQNFAGIVSATGQYNNQDIWFASDISKFGCTGDNCTGAVGATLLGGGTQATPLPGAVWLMGTILGGGAGFSRWRKRKART